MQGRQAKIMCQHSSQCFVARSSPSPTRTSFPSCSRVAVPNRLPMFRCHSVLCMGRLELSRFCLLLLHHHINYRLRRLRPRSNRVEISLESIRFKQKRAHPPIRMLRLLNLRTRPGRDVLQPRPRRSDSEVRPSGECSRPSEALILRQK